MRETVNRNVAYPTIQDDGSGAARLDSRHRRHALHIRAKGVLVYISAADPEPRPGRPPSLAVIARKVTVKSGGRIPQLDHMKPARIVRLLDIVKVTTADLTATGFNHCLHVWSKASEVLWRHAKRAADDDHRAVTGLLNITRVTSRIRERDYFP